METRLQPKGIEQAELAGLIMTYYARIGISYIDGELGSDENQLSVVSNRILE